MATNKNQTLLLSLLLLALSGLAPAQGLYVQPASFEISVKPGANYDLPIEIRNNQSGAPDSVEVGGQFLIQTLQGFDGVDKDKATPEQQSAFPSCLSWLTIPPPINFTLQPLGQQALTLRLAVPASAHGFYGAVVQVTSQRAQAAPGLKLILRFLVPILIHVDSGVSHKSGSTEDATAFYVPADKTHAAGTLVACMIKNTGDTVARFSGSASVFQMVNGRKRRVITGTFDERRIIPNATVALSYMSPNRLPSGSYHIETAITMEGQKLTSLAKDVDVKGDPTVKDAVADVELGVSPDPLEFDALPGATRGLPFKVRNSGTDPIVVTATVSTPKAMQGAVGAVGKGEDFSIAPWCTQPVEDSVVGAGQERTLRIYATVPDGDLANPLYYGELNIVAKTQDGVPVGSGTLLMIGKGKKPAVVAISGGDIVVSSINPKLYGFTSTFSNIGDGHFEPQVDARITDTARIDTLMTLDVSDLPKRILPLQVVRPSGQIDVSLLKDGAYILEVTMKAGDVKETKSAGIRIKTEGGVKKLLLIALAPAPVKTGSKK
jgi:hypothetical protein